MATKTITSWQKPNEPIIENRIGCIAYAMTIIGNKWTALILRDLAAGEKRFSQLQNSISGINPRTLTKRLESLAECGVIIRHASNQKPGLITYKLTNKGLDLVPLLRQMAKWGDKYCDSSS